MCHKLMMQLQQSAIILEQWDEYVRPSDLEVLSTAKSIKDNNILHICGFNNKRNNLKSYREYLFKAVNWATHVENVSLPQGRKIFGGRAVLGGFSNTAKDTLFQADREELILETQRLISETGTEGYLVGADCSIPFETTDQRLRWINRTAYAYNK